MLCALRDLEATDRQGRRPPIRTARLTDGKVVSEEFGGELESAYHRMAMQADKYFVGQLRLLMQPFSWLPPIPRAAASEPQAIGRHRIQSERQQCGVGWGRLRRLWV
jgi:hypothetical protein